MTIKDFVVHSEEEAVQAPALPVHLWLFQELEKNLSELGDKDWLINGSTDERQRFSEIIPKSKALASAMTKLGFKKGDVIMLYSYNTVNYFYPVFAAWICGGTATFVEPASLVDQVVQKANDSLTAIVVADESTLEKAIEVMKNCESVKSVITFGSSKGGLSFLDLIKDAGESCPSGLTFDICKDIAYLPYSSGTTGLPKGIMHTHYSTGNLLARGIITLAPDETGLFSTPMFHLSGFLGSVRPLIDFTPMIFLAEYDQPSYLRALSSYNPAVVFSAPLALNDLINSSIAKDFDLSCVKHFITGGSLFSSESKRKLMELLPSVKTVNIVWGMTEIGLATQTPKELLSDSFHQHSGSLGKVGAGVSLKVIDGEGNSLGHRCVGELCIRSSCNLAGYLNKADETANTITADGWVRTGDCGYYTEDEYIYFTERMKELIKYRGFHVVPAVLEGILLSHPAIKEAGVIGIPQPDVGEHPCACVVFRENFSPSEKEIIDFVNERVCEYEKLRGGVRIFDRLPYVGIGKLSRKDLKKWVMLD